jgi:hypothetical protein
MAAHSFTLSGVALPGDQDPLGIWSVSAEPAVSFSADKAVAAEPAWRIELPDSAEDIEAILTDKGRALELTGENLARVDQELARLSPTVPSFAPSEEFSVQKNALLAAVDEVREPVSFGLLPEKVKDQESYRQWIDLVAQVRQIVAHYARIETTIAGSNVGLTTVSWGGDFATTWESGVTANDMDVHVRSVHLALASRIALLRLVSVIASGAAGLAAKAAIPGGQVLLLPAAWRFVRDVLKELRQSWPQLQALV